MQATPSVYPVIKPTTKQHIKKESAKEDPILLFKKVDIKEEPIPKINAHPEPQSEDTIKQLLEEEVQEDDLAGFDNGEVVFMDDLSSVNDSNSEVEEFKVNRPNKRRRKKLKTYM